MSRFELGQVWIGPETGTKYKVTWINGDGTVAQLTPGKPKKKEKKFAGFFPGCAELWSHSRFVAYGFTLQGATS